MQPLPAGVLRDNLASWAVPYAELPAAAAALRDALPAEAFDPGFRGQDLRTTYLDTERLTLRLARKKGDQYLTLRVRCYRPRGGAESYAVSAKTEDRKFRVEIPGDEAAFLLAGPRPASVFTPLLPADLYARLLELAGDAPLLPAAVVRARRYAAEDDRDRLTLDAAVRTAAGKRLPHGVLEFKSTVAAAVPAAIAALGLYPLKISKFLWATEV